MTTKQLIISSFARFTELKNAKKRIIWKIISLSFMFECTNGITYFLPNFSSAGHYQVRWSKIAAEIPDFKIRDGQIDSPTNEGFIYQTDSIIFTFDPEGKRTPEDISSDLIGNFLSVGLLKDKLVLALPNTGTTSALLNNNQFEFEYTNNALKI